jgi:hypothetical protein
MRIIKLLLPIIFALNLIGCATRETVESDGVYISFESSQKPNQLARCIVKQTDGKILGSLKSHIEPGSDYTEVVIRNGDHIYSLIKIRPLKEGSLVDIYFGGAAKFDKSGAYQIVTKGCV